VSLLERVLFRYLLSPRVRVRSRPDARLNASLSQISWCHSCLYKSQVSFLSRARAYSGACRAAQSPCNVRGIDAVSCRIWKLAARCSASTNRYVAFCRTTLKVRNTALRLSLLDLARSQDPTGRAGTVTTPRSRKVRTQAAEASLAFNSPFRHARASKHNNTALSPSNPESYPTSTFYHNYISAPSWQSLINQPSQLWISGTWSVYE
jgi:hypothetical protein